MVLESLGLVPATDPSQGSVMGSVTGRLTAYSLVAPKAKPDLSGR
jgi:hypothetical protein